MKYIRYSFIDTKYIHKDRYHIHINALYDDAEIYEKINDFKMNTLSNSLFVIAGHSYEFEVKNDWDKIEKLLKFLKEDKDIVVLPLCEAVDFIF